MKTITLTSDDVERFWSNVDTSGDCWIWTASLQPSGYGQMRVITDGRKSTGLAHRLSYQIRHGRTPDLYIDHRCRNRACVNPEHLREVTNKQNMENRTGANSNSSTGIRGVRYNKQGRRWSAEVTHRGKNHWLGLFTSLEDAAAAVVAKRNELFTHNDLDRLAS